MCVCFVPPKIGIFNNKTLDIHLSFTRYMIKRMYTHRFQSLLAFSPRPATGLPLYRWIVYFMEIPVKKMMIWRYPILGHLHDVQ